MDAFVILFLVILVICWACYRRKLEKAAYGIAVIDLALRIFAFFGAELKSNDIGAFLSKFPDSILAVADKYMDGFLYSLVAWAFVILMTYFLALITRVFFKK